jgi:hypothetical protein
MRVNPVSPKSLGIVQLASRLVAVHGVLGDGAIEASGLRKNSRPLNARGRFLRGCSMAFFVGKPNKHLHDAGGLDV